MNSIGDKSDVVIVGGVACGPKTAAVLARRRDDLKITLFQREPRMSYATCGLPYFASGEIPSLAQLTATTYGIERAPDYFRNTKGVDVVTEAEVVKVDRTNKRVTVGLVSSGETFNHGYDKLVLATGAIPNRPPFPIPKSDKVRSFTRPDDAVHFRQEAERGQVGSAVIIGGGFIGCELAESCAGLWGIDTTLIEREPQLLPYVLDPEMAAMVQKEMQMQGVTVVTDAAVSAVRQEDDSLSVEVSDGSVIGCDYVFLCLGVTPNVTLGRECGLGLGETGGLAVNDRMQTSDPHIYAGGDCVESTHRVSGRKIFIPMGSLANRHGRVIAENLAGDESAFPGVVGAFVVKTFDKNCGAVGLSEAAALKTGFDAGSVWGTFPDKPDYYPESATMVLKLVYDRTNLRLLGLQAVGDGDICRRIDVFSSFLQRDGSINDLLEFEHGYAPPFAEALDPLHHLAAMVLAQRRGESFVSPYSPGSDVIEESCKTVWLDVREEEETEADPWTAGGNPSAQVINIPSNELRARLDELDRNASIMVVCRRGPRSYQAAVTLRQAGFADVHVVSGGTTAVEQIPGQKQ